MSKEVILTQQEAKALSNYLIALEKKLVEYMEGDVFASELKDDNPHTLGAISKLLKA